VAWLLHGGGEGGFQGQELVEGLARLSLDHVFLGHAALQGDAGERHRLLNQLGLFGLARWAALGDWHLGDAHLAWAEKSQVPQQSALASVQLVRLGNLGWFNVVDGALLGLLLELGHDGEWEGGAGLGWDPVAGNFQLGLGVDALLGAGNFTANLVLDSSADSDQLVPEDC